MIFNKKIFFIILFLFVLFITPSVFAYEGTAFTEEMINYYTDFIEQHKENYTDYSISRDISWGNYWVHLYSNPIGNKLYMESLEGMNSTELLSGKWYKFDTNNNWQILADQGTFNNIYFQPTITYSIDHEYYYYGSQPLYASNLTDILWENPNTSNNKPSLVTYEDSTLYPSLINGELNGFIIDAKNSVTIYLSYYDYTNSSSYDGVDYLYNGSWNVTLNGFSDYYNSLANLYIIPFSDIPFSYANNHHYLMSLNYSLFNDDNIYLGNVYEWTTNFSQSAIDNYDNSFPGTIDNINNFLNNDNSNNSTIINNIPSNSSYNDPTSDGINNIFTAIRNAFTNNEPITVRFVFPFTNGAYVDIPSDLVSSHMPEFLLLIIQSFYWFLISRFIIKDIVSIVERLRSGDILNGVTDTNIKTEIL